MKRDTLSAYRARQKATESLVDEAVAEVKAERDAAWTAAQEASKAAEAERHHFTRDELLTADLIRTRFGWSRVVKVNQKSVTVDTGYSWTELVPFDRILEAHTLQTKGAKR